MNREGQIVDVMDAATQEVVATYRVGRISSLLAAVGTAGAEFVIYLSREWPDPIYLNIVQRTIPGYSCFGEPATILGTDGDDEIELTPDRDVLVALGGNDRIERASGTDLVCAGDGDDSIYNPGSQVRVRGAFGLRTT